MQLSKEEMQKMFDEVHDENESQSNAMPSNNAMPSKEEMQKMFNEVHGEENQQQPETNWRQELLSKIKGQFEPQALLAGLKRGAEIPINIGASLAQEGMDIGRTIGNIPAFLSGGRIPYLEKQNVPMYQEGTPEEQLLHAAEIASGVGAGTKLGLTGLRYAGSKLGPQLAKFTGKEAAGKAENLIQNLSKETPLSQYHQPIVDKIRNLHAQDSAEGSAKFNAIGNKSIKQGIGPVNQNTLDTLRRLKIKQSSEPALYERIKSFKENPYYNQAHELQSELGKIGTEKSKSLDTAQKELGKKLLDIRTRLESDIIDNFEKNGAKDLAEDYKDAKEFWKNRVKIYDKNKTISDIVKKKGIEEVNPTNIGKILTKDSATTRYILSKLPQEEKNLAIANELKNKSPQEIVEKFKELKNSPYAKLITPEHENVFTDLEKSVEFANKFGKRALKGAAKSGAGLLALLGLDKAGRYTGIL